MTESAPQSFRSTFGDWRVEVGPYCDYDGHVPLRFMFAGERRAVHLTPDDADALARRVCELADEGRRMKAGDPPLRYWARLSSAIQRRERR